MNATTLHDNTHDAHPQPSTPPMRTQERLFWLLDEYCESTTTWCSSLARNASKTSSRKLAKDVSAYVYSQGLDDLPLSTAVQPLRVLYPDMPREVLAAWWEQRDLIPSTNSPRTLTTVFKFFGKENAAPATSSNQNPITTPRWKPSKSLALLNSTPSVSAIALLSTPAPSAPFSLARTEAAQPVSQAGYSTILGKKRFARHGTSSNRTPLAISRWKPASSTPLTSTLPHVNRPSSRPALRTMPPSAPEAVSPPRAASSFPTTHGKCHSISTPNVLSQKFTPASSTPRTEESPTASIPTPPSPATHSSVSKRPLELPVTQLAVSLPSNRRLKRRRVNDYSPLAPPKASATTADVSSVAAAKEVSCQPESSTKTAKQTTRDESVGAVHAEDNHNVGEQDVRSSGKK